MKKFKDFKYNKIEITTTDFPPSQKLTETRYIKDLKYGRKICLIEFSWNDGSDDIWYTVAYYDKKSKKGKHMWWDLCGGFSLEESINLLNVKINHWKWCNYLNYIRDN